jgi:hypothetical protein
VVEAEIVPKTSVAGWFLTEANSGESEPIGNRIIEVPEDLAQFENRDARARFIAYVPAGSIERGEGLVAKGVNGGGTQGAGCHGPGLIGGSGIPASPAFAELRRPPARRFHVRRACRSQQRIDEAGRGKIDRGRHDRIRRLRGIAAAGRRFSEIVYPARGDRGCLAGALSMMRLERVGAATALHLCPLGRGEATVNSAIQ